MLDDTNKAKNLANIANAKDQDVLANAKDQGKEKKKATNLVTTPNAPDLADISKDHRPPSLPPGGESRAAEGGANSQVDFLTNTCMDMNQTNPCFACKPSELNKTADLTTVKKKAMDLAIIIVKTWNPGEEQKKAAEPAVIVKT